MLGYETRRDRHRQSSGSNGSCSVNARLSTGLDRRLGPNHSAARTTIKVRVSDSNFLRILGTLCTAELVCPCSEAQEDGIQCLCVSRLTLIKMPTLVFHPKVISISYKDKDCS